MTALADASESEMGQRRHWSADQSSTYIEAGKPLINGGRPHLVTLAPGITCHIGPARSVSVGTGNRTIAFTFRCDIGGVVVGGTNFSTALTRSSSDIVVTLTAGVCRRTFGRMPPIGRWYMSRELRGIAVALLDAWRDHKEHPLYVQGKGLELLCRTVSLLFANSLISCSSTACVSEAHTMRLLGARALIEERYGEVLTLQAIARASGVNRTKLTTGFLALFGTTVGDFICSTRMSHARDMLLTTDLMIATVGVRCGYTNNSSFSRAFLRHFGASPALFRSRLSVPAR